MDPQRNTYSSRRSVASYFWEFILLFLAVLIALFVYGYWKDQKTNLKENSPVNPIITDMRSDVSNMEKNIKLRNVRYDQLDSMFNIISSKKIFGHEKELYFFAKLITGEVVFTPKKISADTIMSYDQLLNELYIVQKIESEKLKMLYPYLAKIFNPYELEKMEAEDGSIRMPTSSPFLKNADAELLDEFSFYLQDYKSAIRKSIRCIRGLQVRAKRIIDSLENK